MKWFPKTESRPLVRDGTYSRGTTLIVRRSGPLFWASGYRTINCAVSCSLVPLTGDGRRGLVELALSACGSGGIFGEMAASASTGPDSLGGYPRLLVSITAFALIGVPRMAGKVKGLPQEQGFPQEAVRDLAQDSCGGERPAGKRHWGKLVAPRHYPDGAVAAGGGVLVHSHGVPVQVHQPEFLNAAPS